jgi:hypothetical protein
MRLFFRLWLTDFPIVTSRLFVTAMQQAAEKLAQAHKVPFEFQQEFGVVHQGEFTAQAENNQRSSYRGFKPLIVLGAEEFALGYHSSTPVFNVVQTGADTFHFDRFDVVTGHVKVKSGDRGISLHDGFIGDLELFPDGAQDGCNQALQCPGYPLVGHGWDHLVSRSTQTSNTATPSSGHCGLMNETTVRTSAMPIRI